MTEPLDAMLRDHAALEEIEMTSDLMIAASQSDGKLQQDEVDQILGLA